MKEGHEQALLRQRDALLKRRQLWVAGLIIWGVVVGWVLFGVVNSFTDNLDVRVSWLLTWLLPVAVFAVGTLVTMAGLRANQRALDRNAA